METRIILTVLCFTMSFLSLIRGLYLIRLEKQQSEGSSIQLYETVNTLKLIFFNGIKSRNGIVLMWQCNTQIGRTGFSIERRNGEDDFTEIAQIDTPVKGMYKFTDKLPAKNVQVEYRLKQADAFGNVYYSKKVIASHC